MIDCRTTQLTGDVATGCDVAEHVADGRHNLEARLSMKFARLKPVRRDVLTTAACLILSLFFAAYDGASGMIASTSTAAVISAVLAPTLLLRRRVPELAATAGLLGSIATEDVTLLVFALWAVARYGRHGRIQLLIGFPVAYLLTRPFAGHALINFHYAYRYAMLVLPAVTGSAMRRQEQLVAVVRRQAQQVRASVDQAIEHALLQEHTRLALEMHDGVGHNVAVISLQAAALRAHADQPEKVREGADVIEDQARTVMREIREVLNVLRGDVRKERRPESEEDFLPSLVRNMEAVGVQVSCQCSGTPRLLPTDVQLALHRIAQESLTNAMKHAPGAPIRLQLSFAPDEVKIIVSNESPRGPSLSLSDGGLGLHHLRQRTAELGGSLEARPTAQGGFTLRAELPLR